MHTVPVTDSTISAQYLVSFLQKKYGLSSATQCRIFRTGINHSYIVTDRDHKFVFRIYTLNWRSASEISEEIRLLNILKENSISVANPVMDVNQNYIQNIQAPEGLRYGVLFSYAPGKKARNFSEEITYNMGVWMAKFHKITEQVHLKRIDYDVSTLTTLPYQFARQHFPESNEEMQFVREAGNIINYVFTDTSPEALRKGVIHLDIWYDNMHISEAGDMTVFDFDFCGNGWQLHDIAYFIMQLFHIEPDKDVYKSKLGVFFAGYESITKITEEEKSILPYSGLAIWIFYLGVQSQRFDNWSNFFLSENYLKRYIGMAKDWLQFNEIAIKLI